MAAFLDNMNSEAPRRASADRAEEGVHWLEGDPRNLGFGEAGGGDGRSAGRSEGGVHLLEGEVRHVMFGEAGMGSGGERAHQFGSVKR